ncbi:MAG: hypothetical protein ABIZ80_07425 [Bryobacteraceae bacterium]
MGTRSTVRRGGENRAHAALELSKGRDVEYSAAFALTLAGDLEKRFPENTSVRFSYHPALRGLLALAHGGHSKRSKRCQPAILTNTL